MFWLNIKEANKKKNTVKGYGMGKVFPSSSGCHIDEYFMIYYSICLKMIHLQY